MKMTLVLVPRENNSSVSIFMTATFKIKMFIHDKHVSVDESQRNEIFLDDKLFAEMTLNVKNEC